VPVAWALAPLLLLALLLGLAACGVTTAAGPASAPLQLVSTAHATAKATATATPAAGIPGGDRLTGCTARPPADATAPATTTLRLSPANDSQSVTLHPGQTLDVLLPDGLRWTLSASDPSHSLDLHDAVGWHDPADYACVWRVGALTAGTASLRFQGEAVCPMRAVCPELQLEEAATITVR
jgi:hypothetical protein